MTHVYTDRILLSLCSILAYKCFIKMNLFIYTNCPTMNCSKLRNLSQKICSIILCMMEETHTYVEVFFKRGRKIFKALLQCKKNI